MTSRNEESRSGSQNSLQIGAEGRKGLEGKELSHVDRACKFQCRNRQVFASPEDRFNLSKECQVRIFVWYFLLLLCLLEDEGLLPVANHIQFNDMWNVRGPAWTWYSSNSRTFCRTPDPTPLPPLPPLTIYSCRRPYGALHGRRLISLGHKVFLYISFTDV